MRHRVIATPVLVLALTVAACSPAGRSTAPSASNAVASTPSERPTQIATAPLATSTPASTTTADLLPVEGTDLPLAGRDGAPGPVSCGGVGPTTLEALTEGPVGAERLHGPEYDVLRETIARYGDDPEFAPLKTATFREFRPSDGRVVFLGDSGSEEGTFPTVTAIFDDTRWGWAGMDGACQATGEPGVGWGAVNWVVDPGFDRPSADTVTLHLACRIRPG